MDHSNNLLIHPYLHLGGILLGSKSGFGGGDDFQRRTVLSILFCLQECGLVQILTLNGDDKPPFIYKTDNY